MSLSIQPVGTAHLAEEMPLSTPNPDQTHRVLHQPREAPGPRELTERAGGGQLDYNPLTETTDRVSPVGSQTNGEEQMNKKNSAVADAEHFAVRRTDREFRRGSGDSHGSPTVENSPTRYKRYPTRWSNRARTETWKVRDAGSWKRLLKRAAPSSRRRRKRKARTRA
ncbi:hypothetical protein GE09DRAFT_1085433 [Coniochaeta sp. 2T2.1]|nr:hypothetical protein GE09DRAFT_1085433 [Coniochaeta sp. 2T2.1]